MIAKIVTTPERDEHNEVALFADLLKVLTSDRALETCRVVSTNGVGSLDTAAADMASVSAKNSHVRNPALHYIVSWPVDVVPAAGQIAETVTHSLAALGMEGNQHVAVIHQDTRNNMHAHVHVLVNRVHPHTLQAHIPPFAARALVTAVNEVAAKHGKHIVDHQEQEALGAHPLHDHDTVAAVVRTADKLGLRLDPAAVAGLAESGSIPDQSFSGKVVAGDTERGLVFQELGRGEGTVHSMAKLSRVPAIGEYVRVQYVGGVGNVTGKQLTRNSVER